MAAEKKKDYRMEDFRQNHYDHTWHVLSYPLILISNLHWIRHFERNKENLEIGCGVNSKLTVGNQVQLIPFRDNLNKTRGIDQASHILDRSGFHTSFQANCFADDRNMRISKALAIF